MSVLLEEKEAEFCKGHTANYLLVKVKSDLDRTNEMVMVKVENMTTNELIGENVTKM